MSRRELAHRTVSSGKASPCFVKYSKPASKSMNSGVGIEDPKANIASLAGYKTTLDKWSKYSKRSPVYR